MNCCFPLCHAVGKECLCYTGCFKSWFRFLFIFYSFCIDKLKYFCKQNVFLYAFWHFFKRWGIECTSSQSVSKFAFFQAKRSRCLSSSSVLGAGSLYVASSTIIQKVSRVLTSREFAGRSSFSTKFAKFFWYHACMKCAPPFFSSRLSNFFWSHISIPLYSKL